MDDVVAVLPVNELKTLFDKKMETSKDFKSLVTAIHSPEFAVIIPCFYFSYVSCCLCYVHSSV